jgi:excisionase family DNA binding protein
MPLQKVPRVAEALDCSIATVYQLIDSGQLVAVKIGAKGGGVRVSDEDLQTFIDSRRTRPREEKHRVTRPTLKHIQM